MVKKIIFFFFLFYFLILFQTSFMAHFNFLGVWLNFVLIGLVLIHLSGLPDRQKTIASLIVGLLLDIFSLGRPFEFFGFYLLILLLFSFIFRLIFKRYIRVNYV